MVEFSNQIYLGDCVELLKNIPDESIDIVISDIPYGINYSEWDVLHKNRNSALLQSSPANIKSSSMKKRGKPINGWSKDDKNISKQYQEWCDTWTKETYRVTKQGSPILIFSSRRYLHRVCNSLEDNELLIRDIIIWKKNRCNGKAQNINNVLNKRNINNKIFDNYRIGNLAPIYEPIIWAMKPYKKTLTDCIIKDMIGGFYCENGILPSNIIEHPVNTRNSFHPCEKPVGLLESLLKLFTISENTLVLDMFAGSGSLAIACINTNRKYICMEKDESYFKVMESRIKEHLGKTH